MEPVTDETTSKKDSATLGILAGLGLGFAGAVASVVLFVLLAGKGYQSWYVMFIRSLPFVLPLAPVIYFGITARRGNKPRFSAGIFVAAALIVLLEGTCAAYIWNS
jgi:ABC-type amino acid transport system permease subunit